MATYRQKFERALARDRATGGERRSDAVLCEMLGRVGRPRPAKKAPAARVVVRRGVGLSKPAKPPAAAKKSARLLVSSSRRSWTPEQIAAALDDGVKRGKISGSAAAAALCAFRR
jgi:hypothetical protein